MAKDTIWLGLIERAANGEESAFASLYDETNSLVYGLSLRMLGNSEDAEEVTLDVYNQVWRTARTFDGGRGTVTAWLITLTRTRALDKIRARTSRERNIEPIGAQFDAPGATANPEQQSADSEQRRIIRRALDQLPREQRQALELAYFQGLSHSELAEQLGEPLGTVKTRIRLGMMKLRELLQFPSGTRQEAGA